MPKLTLALVLALPASLALGQAAQAPERPTLAPATATAAPPRSEARAEPPPAAKPIPRGAVLEEVSGTVREIDRKQHRLAVDSPKGPVSLALDRNTMVYTAAGLGTMLDLAPGQQIRAGRNADFLAYWVQVRSPAKPSQPPGPGQGTGPAERTGAPAEGPGSAPAGTGPSGGAPPGK